MKNFKKSLLIGLLALPTCQIKARIAASNKTNYIVRVGAHVKDTSKGGFYWTDMILPQQGACDRHYTNGLKNHDGKTYQWFTNQQLDDGRIDSFYVQFLLWYPGVNTGSEEFYLVGHDGIGFYIHSSVWDNEKEEYPKVRLSDDQIKHNTFWMTFADTQGGNAGVAAISNVVTKKDKSSVDESLDASTDYKVIVNFRDTHHKITGDYIKSITDIELNTTTIEHNESLHCSPPQKIEVWKVAIHNDTGVGYNLFQVWDQVRPGVKYDDHFGGWRSLSSGFHKDERIILGH